MSYRVYAERKRSIRALLSGDARQREMRDVEAVRGASFVISRGEAVGVVGHNGSGKSTLLRALAGLLPIVDGSVHVRSTPALLGVKAALEADLSARQNVFIGGAALRIPRSQLDKQFDEIVEFAEVGDHLDLPLRAFSSGMKARLQFAIATAARPEILMIDEALSVGDADFKERAEARMRRMIEQSGTLLLVSHSLGSILDLCERTLWMHEGQLVADGPSTDVVGAYKANVKERKRLAKVTDGG